MKYGLRSEPTNESCNHSTSTLHNCPSCRCTQTSFLKPNAKAPPICNNILNSSFSSTAIQPAKNSIYVYPDYLSQADRSSQLFRSHILETRSRGDHSETKSTSKNNITFTYISPSKKKHQSIDGKFSTKQFKLKHFPFLESHHQQPSKEQFNHHPYYATYNQESPPKKHKILRLSKSKSQNKLKTISSQLSQRDSTFTASEKGEGVKQKVEGNQKGQDAIQKGVVVKQKGEVLKQKEELKDEVDCPRITPISALWQKPDRKEPSFKLIAQAMRHSKVELQRPSIQKVQFQRSVHSEAVSEQVRIPTNTQLDCHFAQSNLTYSKPNPSISHQHLPYLTFNIQHLTAINHQRAQSENTLNGAIDSKVNFWKEKSVKLSQDLALREGELAGKEEAQLGEQLSEELQLNFDYYCPSNDYYIAKTESDRSVSVSVSLY